MAKSKKPKPEVNKTQAVKEAMKKSPKLGPKDLAEKLKAEGIEVSPAYVSTIKSGIRRKAKRRVPGSAKGTNGRPRSGKGDFVAVDALSHAKEFIEKAGGVAEARKALDVIAQFS